MAQNFERLTVWEDPYDIMCGECEVTPTKLGTQPRWGN